MCDCSTSEKFIQNQVPCSYNLKSISFLLVMYTIRARCKIIIGHCIGCIDVMRCVCFQTGFQVTRRPSYCSDDHVLPKFFLPYQNKPAARLFFLCLANFKQTTFATSCHILLPSIHNRSFFANRVDQYLKSLYLARRSEPCARRFALSICRQWHLHVPGIILEFIQAPKKLSMPI